MNITIQKIEIDDLKLNLIELVSKQPFEVFTIDKIRKLIAEEKIKTNYATIHRNVGSLVKQGIFTKSMYGMASQIRLDLSNEKTISLLSLIETQKFKSFMNQLKGIIYTCITDILKDTKEIPELRCILIFGSYAKGTSTRNSDLDILIIYEPSHLVRENLSKNGYDKYLEEIQQSIRGILRANDLKGGPKMSPIIVNGEEFKEMIVDDKPNIAKETLLNHLIINGSSEYWRQIAWCKQNVV